jgi:hypothetical protein
MNLKKKIASVKDKIKQNSPVIIAIASTSAAVGIAVANHIVKNELKAEHAKELLRRCDARNGESHFHLSEEENRDIAEGNKARFIHPDFDFDLIVQKE